MKSRKRVVGCRIAADKKAPSVRRNDTRFKSEPARGDIRIKPIYSFVTEIEKGQEI